MVAFRLPRVRQELAEFAQLRLPDLGQHAHQLLLRIDPMTLGAGDQRIQAGVIGAGLVLVERTPFLAERTFFLLFIKFSGRARSSASREENRPADSA